MRILHVTTFLQGGAGRIITALACAQRRAGHDVLVALDAGDEPGYGTYPEYREALADGGVRVQPVTSTFKRDLALNTRAARELHDALGAWMPDLAHAHAAIPSLVARLALGSRAVPVVQTMHGWGVAKSEAHACTDVALLNLADAVITPSDAARATLRNLGVRDGLMTTVPYGIADGVDEITSIDVADRALFETLRAGGAGVALCIGTIGARKNQRLLIEAIADPHWTATSGGTSSGSARPAPHAVFIGDGDAEMLRQEAETHGVRERVHVLGYRHAASRYLPWGDVLVLPSKNEGLPLVVLEALRDGVAIVASDIPEIAEAIDDRHTGYLFEEGSAGALVTALADALGRTPACAEAMRQRMRARFTSRYTADRMTAAYDDVYRRVMHATPH
jgi:glycosyltransferase involved in cell wall biosynthesis